MENVEENRWMETDFNEVELRNPSGIQREAHSHRGPVFMLRAGQSPCHRHV